VWASRRLLDQRQSSDQLMFLDDVLQDRAQLAWEHIFSLLALILPREPLRIAFRALHTDDRQLHGLALEYLDSVLPKSLHRVQDIFEIAATPAPATAASKDLATRLMDARETVTFKLAKGLPAAATQDE
jgi:hypothetical protein